MNADQDSALQVATRIDADLMARIEASMRELVYERALAARHRRLAFFAKARRIRAGVILGCCFTGLAGALAFTFTGGLVLDGTRVDLWFAAVFILLSPLAWLLAPIDNWAMRPWPAYWQTLASIHVRRALKQARARLPLEARYLLDGATLTYSRAFDGKNEHAWRRELHGVRASGDGFTLFFKKPNAMSYYALMLHAPSPALDAHLDRLGIARLP